jgi:catechol 2,3-dioxygenase-like lactoylglutathione lyase family enzyme
MRLDTLTLTTRDLGRARAFYTGKLGFPILEHDEQSFIVDAGGVKLHVDRAFDLARAPLVHPEPRLVFDTDELQARCLKLRDLGVSVEGPRAGARGQFAELSDPDGHPIILREK